jgi:hypothetical protein
VTARVPFAERGGALRGLIDLAAGRYPSFLFGASVGDVLPVFHFHEVTRETLEPQLAHLADGGYRTVTSDEIASYVRREKSASPSRQVALCFDDAWQSLWTVAGPLLKRYGMRAITYAIPARMTDADDCRPTIDDGVDEVVGTSPFVTWPELRRLSASGEIDVQCHTESHSRIFCSATVADFVTPGYDATPLLNRPQLAPAPGLRFVTTADLGAPLYVARSRMSDARRAIVPVERYERAVEYVEREGGAAFFTRADWQSVLRQIGEATTVNEFESESDRVRAIEEELDRGRSVLNDRLGVRSVNHICLPWGVSSADTAAALARLGYRSAFANRMGGLHAVRPGDDPYWLKRLANWHIFRLPGPGRRLWH